MPSPKIPIHVVIVRDRKAAGGGIFSYYEAVGSHLNTEHELVDMGRTHGFYGAGEKGFAHRLPTPLRLLFDGFQLGFRLLRLPDLVVLNPCMDPIEFRSLPRDAVNLLLAKMFRRKVLVFWRGWDNEVCGRSEFPGGNRGWISRIYRLADSHLVLAGDFRDDLRCWGFTAPIDLETTVVADSLLVGAGKVDTKADGELDDGCFHILYLSRVEQAKGVFELLDAFLLLEKRCPGRFRLTIAGDGPDLEELKNRASDLRLTGVDFKGYVEGPEKVRCFTKATAFCFLSYTEGMPNAVLEAMAMGLPLVSSDAGGLNDILTEGVTGHIVRQDRSRPAGQRFSAEEVAERLEGLAASPEMAERMGEYNRVFARERFSASKVAGRLDAIYQEVCCSPGR